MTISELYEQEFFTKDVKENVTEIKSDINQCMFNRTSIDEVEGLMMTMTDVEMIEFEIMCMDENIGRRQAE